MADDPVDIVADEVDKISGLPDDVLLDILGRLAMAGDVRTVARTSILSRRWRSLPWPQIPTVSLDVGDFFRWDNDDDNDDDEWRPVRHRRRQHRFGGQHQATAGLTAALARFLPCRRPILSPRPRPRVPPSAEILPSRARHLPWRLLETETESERSSAVENLRSRGHRDADEPPSGEKLAGAVLAAPATATARVIETLRLKLILTRRDHVRRVGELIGAAADAGAVKAVELELVTEMEMPMETVAFDADARTKLGYGEQFRHFRQDCPGAFRSLTKLALQNLWFDDPAEVNSLVCACHALQHLSLTSCGLCPKAWLLATDDAGDDADYDEDGDDDYDDYEDDGDYYDDDSDDYYDDDYYDGGDYYYDDDGGDYDDDGDNEPPSRLPMLTIDAPQSRLQALVCDHCFLGGVKLVQAPELVTLEYNAGRLRLLDYHPISIGCAPSLQRLVMHQYQQHEDSFFNLRLSKLLASSRLESTILAFNNGKIWFQPERLTKQLTAALAGLKDLYLGNIHHECNYLSCTTFLLEAAPLLETLQIHIYSHICEPMKKQPKDTNLSWEPSPGFSHHHLKQLSFHRAFQTEKDLPFARRLMVLAPNLQAVTLGVRSLECPACVATQRKRPDMAASRLKFVEGSKHAHAFVRALKDGIHTSAQITLILPEPV